MAEKDPFGKSPHTGGAKLDKGKPMAGMLADFGLALLAVAKVGTHGAKKYTRTGWKKVPNGRTRYNDAMWRHLLEMQYKNLDAKSGLPHEAHFAWNVLACLEIRLRKENAGNKK